MKLLTERATQSHAADVESETPLLSRDIKVNAKTLIGGAAAAAFALGALAATAVASAPQPAPAALYTAPRAPSPRPLSSNFHQF